MNLIPKHAYFYWGNDRLPWLRYMTLYTFRKFNPKWKITIFRPEKLSPVRTWTSEDHSTPVTGSDWWPKVQCLNIEESTLFPGDFGIGPDVSEVMKSDFLRLYLLGQHGGLWSDMDIIYFRPVEHALTPSNSTAYFCKHRLENPDGSISSNPAGYHRIGFLLGAPKNRHFQKLRQLASSAWNPDIYQSVGAHLYKHNVDMSSSDLVNIPMACVYPSSQVQQMFSSSTLLNKIRHNTIGWHWFGGNPIAGQYQNLLTPDNYRKQRCGTISSLLWRVLA